MKVNVWIMTTYLDHDDVERDADRFILKAPLAELVVGHASHDLAKRMSRRWRLAGNIVHEFNRMHSREFAAPCGIWLFVRYLRQRIKGKEHHNYVAGSSKNIADSEE